MARGVVFLGFWPTSHGTIGVLREVAEWLGYVDTNAYNEATVNNPDEVRRRIAEGVKGLIKEEIG